MANTSSSNLHAARSQSWYRKPKPLQPGDTVGVVAPASPVNPSRLEQGLEGLRQRGFNVKVGQHVYGHHSLFAGSDRERAADIATMIEDPSVAAVFCARGGYGTQRLLPSLGSLVQTTSPKWVVGYSDITALHSLLQHAGWVSLHGPMPDDWVGLGDGGFSVDAMFSMLGGAAERTVLLPPNIQPQCVHPGSARGRLVGGNLSLLAALLGTPFELDAEGAILFVEEVNEAPYRVDRMLSSLKLAGKFDGVRGVILGDFTDCHPAPGAPPVSVDDVLGNWFEAMGVPVIKGFPAGHGTTNVPLPLGLDVELDADRGLVHLLSSPTVHPT